ncbi:MAG TPA: hypothetical protein VIJ38_07385 [Acidobacteriaceae bacterium]
MALSEKEMLEILRHEEAKLLYAGNSRVGPLTGEMIAVAGMQEVERRYVDALIKSRDLLRDRANASSWWNDNRMFELFHNVLEPLIGRIGS